MIQGNGELQENVHEEVASTDPEQLRKSQEVSAIESYARILMGIAKRHHQFDEILAEKSCVACQQIFAGLSEACSEGSLCTTVETINSILATKNDREINPGTLTEDGINCLITAGIMASAENGGEPEKGIPLIFDRKASEFNQSRIYFQRYWFTEKKLAEQIAKLCRKRNVSNEYKQILSELDKSPGKLSPQDTEKSNKDRRNAVEAVLQNNLAIISGGPGTGKTTAVATVLECLLRSNPVQKIALAAPTGKAAGRMLESVNDSVKRNQSIFTHLQQYIVEKGLPARTLHKWLVEPQENGSRPSDKNRFDYDVLVIDEASMIDVELAFRIFSVIDPDKTRIILLGDQYQLAAVGPGSVLAELCADDSPLRENGCVANLEISHRFMPDGSIDSLAKKILENTDDQFDIQKVEDPDKIIEYNLDAEAVGKKQPLSESAQKWVDGHIKAYAKAVRNYLSSDDLKVKGNPLLLWNVAKKFQALAALRNGPMSVDAVNDYAQRCLWNAFKNEKLNLTSQSGQIIIVRKNDNDLEVYNGDVGIVLPQQHGSKASPMVYFGDRAQDGRIKKWELPLGVLPEYQPAFAITIHQSQGSEYEEVAVFLPQEAANPLATKELLYTAITRVKTAKDDKSGKSTGKLTLFGNPKSYNWAAKTQTQRSSGLKDRIKEALAQKI